MVSQNQMAIASHSGERGSSGRELLSLLLVPSLRRSRSTMKRSGAGAAALVIWVWTVLVDLGIIGLFLLMVAGFFLPVLLAPSFIQSDRLLLDLVRCAFGIPIVVLGVVAHFGSLAGSGLALFGLVEPLWKPRLRPRGFIFSLLAFLLNAGLFSVNALVAIVVYEFLVELPLYFPKQSFWMIPPSPFVL